MGAKDLDQVFFGRKRADEALTTLGRTKKKSQSGVVANGEVSRVPTERIQQFTTNTAAAVPHHEAHAP